MAPLNVTVSSLNGDIRGYNWKKACQNRRGGRSSNGCTSPGAGFGIALIGSWFDWGTLPCVLARKTGLPLVALVPQTMQDAIKVPSLAHLMPQEPAELPWGADRVGLACHLA